MKNSTLFHSLKLFSSLQKLNFLIYQNNSNSLLCFSRNSLRIIFIFWIIDIFFTSDDFSNDLFNSRFIYFGKLWWVFITLFRILFKLSFWASFRWRFRIDILKIFLKSFISFKNLIYSASWLCCEFFEFFWFVQTL